MRRSLHAVSTPTLPNVGSLSQSLGRSTTVVSKSVSTEAGTTLSSTPSLSTSDAAVSNDRVRFAKTLRSLEKRNEQMRKVQSALSAFSSLSVSTGLSASSSNWLPLSLSSSSRRVLSTSTSSSSATASSPSLSETFTLGAVVHGFTVESAVAHPTLNMTVYTLSHPSGAEYLHVERADGDNAFCVAFRTLPTSDNGVAHVLEHTVLCGSESYPVRDPFFLLLRRSLNTFMNAVTRPEATYYPFSTQNRQDYRNLLSVYLDAVFFPKIEEMDFRQEGHRLEVAKEDGGHDESVEDANVNGNATSTTNTSAISDASLAEQVDGLRDGLDEEDLAALEELQTITRLELHSLSLPASVKEAIAEGFVSSEPDAAFDLTKLTSEARSALLKVQFLRAAQAFSSDGSLEDSKDGNSIEDTRRVEFKGVVFNEMKGALSDSGSYFAHAMEKHLFTSPVYRHNSGGDPESILTLTHEQLLAFHRQFYHPSNACFMSYGNFPPLETMKSVNDKIKARLGALEELKYSLDVYPSLEAVTPQQKQEGLELLRESERFQKPKTVVQLGPESGIAADPVRQSKFVLGWLCKEDIITDVRSRSLLAKQAPVKDWEKRFPIGSVPLPDLPYLDPQYVQRPASSISTKEKEGENESEDKDEMAENTSEGHGNSATSAATSQNQAPTFNFSKLLAKPYTAESDVTVATYTAEAPEPIIVSSNTSTSTISELESMARAVARQEYIPTDTTSSAAVAETAARESAREAAIHAFANTPHRARELNEAMEEVGLAVLASLLLEQPSSPLYELLSDPEIGQGPAPYTGIETSMMSFPFCMGISGTHPTAIPALAKRVLAALEAVADTGAGLEADKVEAMLHQIELSLKDVSSGFGVNLLQRLVPVFATGRDTQAGLLVLDLLHLLRRTSGEYGSLYLRSLLRHHLLSNPHRVLFVMHADPRFASHLRAREKALADTITADLRRRPDELDDLEVRAERLERRQNTPADPSCLPSLSVKDIAAEAKQYVFRKSLEGRSLRVTTTDLPSLREHFREMETNKKIATRSTSASKRAAVESLNALEAEAMTMQLSRAREVSWNPQPTNSIVVVRAVVDDLLDRLTPYQVSLLPLLAAVFGRLGAGGRDYKQLMHEIDLFTGGIGFRAAVETPSDRPDRPRLLGMFTGKSLARHAPKMVQLLADMATAPDFTQHLYSVLTQYSGAVQNSLQESGARFARKDAAARLPGRPAAVIEQYLSGVPNAQFVTQIIQRVMAESKAASDLTKEDGEREVEDGNGVNGVTTSADVESKSEGHQEQEYDEEGQRHEQGMEQEQEQDNEPVPSPLLMKIANDLSELVRCMVLGPNYELEIGLLQHQNRTAEATEAAEKAANAVSLAETEAAEATLTALNQSLQKHLDDADDVESTDMTEADINSETMASFTNRQAKLGAFIFPPSRSNLGFDRVLVTADEETLTTPSLRAAVGALVDSGFTVTPSAYRPRCSDDTEHFSMGSLKRRIGKKNLAARIDAHINTTSLPGEAALWATVEKRRAEAALAAGLPAPTPIEHGFFVSKAEATAVKPSKKKTENGEIETTASLAPTFVPARGWLEELTALNGTAPVFPASPADVKEKVMKSLNETPSVVSNVSTPSTTSISKRKNFIALPMQVNNVVMCLATPSCASADHAVLTVLAEVVTEGYLHREVREKGGAYGSFASQDRAGVFTLGSYRDPNVEPTITALEAGLRWARNAQNYSDRLIDEAKLSLFQSIDAPETPTDAGVYPFLRGTSQEERQRFRTALLSVTKEQIEEVANRVFTDAAISQAQVSVVGSDQNIPAACSDANSEWSLTSLDAMLDAESEVDPDAESEPSF